MVKQPKPTGPLPAKIMLVDECFRKADVEDGFPFSGYLGQELGSMLAMAGIRMDHCYSTWAVRYKAASGGESYFARKKKDITQHHKLLHDLPTMPQVHENLPTLIREIELCKPNVILAFGNTAMFILTGKWGIQNYRGSTLDCALDIPGLSYVPKVIPTYPISRVLWQHELKPIMRQDLKRVMTGSASHEHIRPDYKFIIRPNLRQVLAIGEYLLRQLNEGPYKIAVDIETRSYHIACVQLAWSRLDAITIPCMCKERKDGYWAEEDEYEVVEVLRAILTHPNCQVVGQNFQYDAQYLRRYFFFIPRLKRDTMTAQHSMFSTMEKGLDFLSSMYCDYHCYWKSEGKEWTADMDEEQLWIYGAKDAVITYEVDEAQQKAIKQLGLQSVDEFQQALWWPVFDAITFGYRIDKQLKESFIMKLLEEIAAREQWIYDMLGFLPNLRSPQQMASLFFEDLGQKRVMKRRTGNKYTPSTDDEALRTIMSREPLLIPLCKKIAEIRSLGVFLSTFARAPLDIDGRMRCTYQIPGAETYRFKSKKNAFGTGTNLQNIPAGGEEDGLTLPNIKTAFIPDPGMEDFDIDLDSADLRIVCWESDCMEMKAMIEEGKKVYVEVAKEYYKDPTITKKHPKYRIFKGLCHGTNYLGTAKGLADRLGLLVHETEQIQSWYFGKFPEILKWQEEIKTQAKTRRMVQNVFGYRYYILQKFEGTIMNQIIAWIPQSTVACLINRIWMRIYENLPDVQIKLQVHDSLVGQYPIVGREKHKQSILDEAHKIILPYDDPTVIPVGIKTSSRSWGDC